MHKINANTEQNGCYYQARHYYSSHSIFFIFHFDEVTHEQVKNVFKKNDAMLLIYVTVSK
jgi:hypothetical protein